MTEEHNDYTIAVSNQKIYEFYNKNPNVDFENVNLLLIDFMDSIFNNMTNDLNIESIKFIINRFYGFNIQQYDK